MYKTVFNPSDSPVTVSASGRTVGGHDWGTVQTTEQEARSAIDNGYLLVQDELEQQEGASYNPSAVEAHKRTADYADRHEKASNLDNEALYNLAVQHRLTPEVETVSDRPNKTELVTLVVESSTEIPSPTQAKREQRKADEKKEA